MIKIGVVGSRKRDSNDDFILVRSVILVYMKVFGTENITIVSGGCPKGGDKFAEIIAEDCGIKTIIYCANWEKHGKAAGFIRNTFIARDSDVLIAVVAEDRKGGTEHTIKEFQKFHPNGKLILR